MSVIIPNAEHSVFDQWITALNEHNVSALCNLYASNAILIPATSNEIKYAYDDIQEHFEYLMTKEDIKAELLNNHTRYENGHRIDTGNYQFTWQEGGEIVSAKVRFSFLVDNHKIVVHHSSFWPQE